MRSGPVYVLPLTGEFADARNFATKLYPGRECVILSKRELREGGWRGQIKAFRLLRGEALIFFVRSWSEIQEPMMTVWSSVLHRCRFTVLADSSGRVLAYGRFGRLRLFPKVLASAVSDVVVFAAAWLLIRVFLLTGHPARTKDQSDVDLDLAFLYPYPLDRAAVGGAMSHVEGFLSGVAQIGGRCEVFSGRPLPSGQIPENLIPATRQLFLFRESLMLSYNLRFALKVHTLLRGRAVRAFYQRHGRFTVVGALLSSWLGIPFVLEYNGSESRIADLWDPARFRSWLRLCEEVSLSRAHQVVVVSEPLRQELLRRGVPVERILLNPNAVDTGKFHPGCGGGDLRARLGILDADIVVTFVGTFNYFHGVRVLEGAIRQLLVDHADEPLLSRLRFVLVGDGPLFAEIRDSMEKLGDTRIYFTGLIPHSRVPAYLDATDILVSPHVPMPDGQPFFGSPTKLFEYMAMAKAIVASNLDQLASLLCHGRSAWLVEPGNVSELASAILLLARNPELRGQLGRNARASAMADHTWKQNAERVLLRVGDAPARVGSLTRPVQE